jgi:hypothetical protein
MRIKSYFAPSVQAAIALARKEFGDGVTLVTSHVASLDNRHLGEYEVVFAIEETVQEVVETPATEPTPVFTQLFQQAVEAPPALPQKADEKLENIHSSLVSLGLEAAVVRSFMTMLKAVLPTTPAAITLTPITTLPAPAPINTIPATPIPTVATPAPIVPAPTSTLAQIPTTFPIPGMSTQSHERSDWSLPPAKPKITVIKPEPAPTRPFLSLFEAPRPEPRFSAAELAFMSSVSSDEEQKA